MFALFPSVKHCNEHTSLEEAMDIQCEHMSMVNLPQELNFPLQTLLYQLLQHHPS